MAVLHPLNVYSQPRVLSSSLCHACRRIHHEVLFGRLMYQLQLPPDVTALATAHAHTHVSASLRCNPYQSLCPYADKIGRRGDWLINSHDDQEKIFVHRRYCLFHLVCFYYYIPRPACRGSASLCMPPLDYKRRAHNVTRDRLPWRPSDTQRDTHAIQHTVDVGYYAPATRTTLTLMFSCSSI
jgi:hypothetical protein